MESVEPVGPHHHGREERELKRGGKPPESAEHELIRIHQTTDPMAEVARQPSHELLALPVQEIADLYSIVELILEKPEPAVGGHRVPWSQDIPVFGWHLCDGGDRCH